MKKTLTCLIATILTAGSISQAVELCDPNSNPLYKDIMIYNETEKILPDEGLIGEDLNQSLSRRAYDGTIKEKVMSVETGFAKCVVMLTAEEEEDIVMAIETAQRMKNPLFND